MNSSRKASLAKHIAKTMNELTRTTQRKRLDSRNSHLIYFGSQTIFLSLFSFLVLSLSYRYAIVINRD